jgi:hypothetical protein
VRWTKTRWRCRQDYCERSSFTEAIAQVPARARTTRRLRTQIGAAIGDAARSVSRSQSRRDDKVRRFPTANCARTGNRDYDISTAVPACGNVIRAPIILSVVIPFLNTVGRFRSQCDRPRHLLRQHQAVADGFHPTTQPLVL